MSKIHETYEWELLTPQGGNYFFGYYDRTALSPDNRRHLALRAPQQERLPRIGEKAEVGYVDVEA
ncbi:MAG: hypothetical protein JXR97_03970, partial [Planctomycetes bacterium]|nr:hypothetical protein [Planctomycetota bacterium]